MSSFDDAFTENYLNTMYPSRMEGSQEFPMREGALEGRMEAVPQTGLQKFAESLGVTLQEIGQGLENMPPIQIRRTGQTLDMKDLLFGIGARDLFPFLGSSEERPVGEMRTMTGKPIDVAGEQPSGEMERVEKGTPQILQQMGKGMSPVVGRGMTTELRPDAKEAMFDVTEFAGIGKAGKTAKAATKALAPKAAEMAEDFLTKRGMLLQFGPDNKQVEIPAAPKLETPAFKNWFRDSKVVDDQGKPLVVYHGTNKSEDGQAFSSFDTYGSNYGLMGQGSYFTREPNIASDYTKKGKGDSPTVYPVYLSIKNPIDMDAKANPKEWLEKFPDAKSYHDGGDTNQSWYRAAEEAMMDNQIPAYEGAEAMQEGLRSMGYDGIKHIGGGRVDKDGIRHQVYIAFDPEQIKSVFNKGTWNPNDPRMSYGVGAGGAGAASQQEDK